MSWLRSDNSSCQINRNDFADIDGYDDIKDIISVLDSDHTYNLLFTGPPASAKNDLSKLSKPLASRFRRLNLPKYTKDQFLDVAIKVCPKLAEETALFIGKSVWNTKGDVRDIISISKLVHEEDGPEEIEEIMSTFKKYGDQQSVDLPYTYPTI